MQCGARFFQTKSLSCSVALVLRFPNWAPSARGGTRRDFRESAPMQRGAPWIKIAFPRSVPLKVLGIILAPALSHVTFSNTLGFGAFIVLKLWCSGALFSDTPWPSLAVLSIS